MDTTPRALFSNEAFSLSSHGLIQGESQVRIEPNCWHITHKGEQREIKLPKEHAGLPSYKGGSPLLSSMFRLAIEELQANENDEGLLKAGFSWDGVWTRDSAYAILLGASIVLPDACMASLKARVRGGRIMQDTGTGGSWPISTDRVIWAEAAWNLYNITGDVEWRDWSADVIEATLQQDEQVLRCYRGLFPGETSFIDWREQSYPDWMNTSDIGASYSLSTNILHASARRILSLIRNMQGRHEEAAAWQQQSDTLRAGIKNEFWDNASRQFGMMRTIDGHLDERVDALATALCILSGIAVEHAADALQNIPKTLWGCPCFSPYKSSQQGSYHNRSIWPFVQAFVLMAQARENDLSGVEESMACLFRAALLFGSNKENFHAVTGEASDTIQNSDGQLWSAAGMLSLYFFVLFGLRFEGKNLVFTPCVPKAYAGSHWLTGIKILDMVLDIHIVGYGTVVSNTSINGKIDMPLIPLNSKGRMLIELELMPEEEDEEGTQESDRQEAALTSNPPTEVSAAQPRNKLTPHPTRWANEDLPSVQWKKTSTKHLLDWEPVAGATAYRIFRAGKAITQTANCQFAPPDGAQASAAYRVQAINEDSASLLNQPFFCYSSEKKEICPVDHMGEHGEFHVENQQAWLDRRACTAQLFFAEAQLRAGTYFLRILYCNATASKRDGDGCALRALYDGDACLGIIPLPQNTEANQWDDFTLTAPLILNFEEGEHQFSLRYTDACDKGTENQCMIKQLELIQLSGAPEEPNGQAKSPAPQQ